MGYPARGGTYPHTQVLAAVVEAIQTGREVELVLEGKVYRVVVRAG